MILEKPLKGGIVEVRSLTNSNMKRYKPVMCLTDAQGQRYYLSWENLTKLINEISFDIDQKKIRKHLIPLTNEVPVQP